MDKERMCIVCRQMKNKKELLRIVKDISKIKKTKAVKQGI